MATTRSTAIRTMAIARGALGITAYAAPDTTARALGLDPGPNRQLRLMGRTFGARDVALAVGLLSAEGPTQRTLFNICVAVEAADVVSTLLARRSRAIDTRATALLLAAVAAAAIPEAIALAATSAASTSRSVPVRGEGSAIRGR